MALPYHPVAGSRFSARAFLRKPADERPYRPQCKSPDCPRKQKMPSTTAGTILEKGNSAPHVRDAPHRQIWHRIFSEDRWRIAENRSEVIRHVRKGCYSFCLFIFRSVPYRPSESYGSDRPVLSERSGLCENLRQGTPSYLEAGNAAAGLCQTTDCIRACYQNPENGLPTVFSCM